MAPWSGRTRRRSGRHPPTKRGSGSIPSTPTWTPPAKRWPDGTRMIARREDPHPGAQLTFTDIEGHRFQVCVTDLTETDTAYLEALYRGRGRAERRICDNKDTGLANLPSWSFAINQAWLEL